MEARQRQLGKRQVQEQWRIYQSTTHINTTASRKLLLSPAPQQTNLPNIHTSVRARISEAHDWHLRMNHVGIRNIQKMARQHAKYGLPRSLAHSKISSTGSGCAIGHMQKSPHKTEVRRQPPRHTIAGDIVSPLPRTKAIHQYFLAVLRYRTGSKLYYSSKAKVKRNKPCWRQ